MAKKQKKITDKRILKLIQLYQQARKDLLDIILKSEIKGTPASYERALLSQVEEELKGLNGSCKKWCQETLPGFYQEGTASIDDFLKNHNLPISGSFAKLHKRAIDIIIDNTVTDLVQANKFVGRKIRDELRDVSLEVIGQKLATGRTVHQTKNMLIDRITTQGIAFIKNGKGQVSLNNKTYQLDRYAEMVARSTTREATNRGTLNQLTNRGYDLVKISDHNSPCPQCSMYEGRVYSISGEDKRFPPLDVAYDGEFLNIHPNCIHVITPFIEDFAKDIDAEIKNSNRAFEVDDSKVKDYYEQQKEKRELYRDQRQYERYKAVLGEDAPKSFSGFRRMKSTDSENWQELQLNYRETRKELSQI
jgi:hypothetical protein